MDANEIKTSAIKRYPVVVVVGIFVFKIQTL